MFEHGFAEHAKWFAERGYVVVGADYTLATTKKHTWNIQEKQIACALAWTNANAKRFGGDISRLGAFGDSAGGNLILNVAYKSAAGKLQSQCGELPKIDALSGLYPATDLAGVWTNKDPLWGQAQRWILRSYIGGSPAQFPARYRAVSTLNAVSSDAPPTLVVNGTNDQLVSKETVDAFVSKLKADGVTVKHVAVPFQQHGFGATTASIGSQIWRDATLRFFRSHGAS